MAALTDAELAAVYGPHDPGGVVFVAGLREVADAAAARALEDLRTKMTLLEDVEERDDFSCCSTLLNDFRQAVKEVLNDYTFRGEVPDLNIGAKLVEGDHLVTLASFDLLARVLEERASAARQQAIDTEKSAPPSGGRRSRIVWNQIVLHHIESAKHYALQASRIRMAASWFRAEMALGRV